MIGVGESARLSIASHEGRVAELADRQRRMKQVIDERAAAMNGEAPGAGSGLLSKDWKGKNADQPVYKVDTGLLSELRAHEQQAAQELGQWDAGAGPSVAIQIVIPAAANAGNLEQGCEIDITPGKR